MLKFAKYGKFCKFTRKIVIKSDKKLGMVLIIGDDVEAWTGLCAFLNIVINANIARKLGKIRKTE